MVHSTVPWNVVGSLHTANRVVRPHIILILLCSAVVFSIIIDGRGGGRLNDLRRYQTIEVLVSVSRSPVRLIAVVSQVVVLSLVLVEVGALVVIEHS